ncbi:MAG TPA: hypothetical protein VJ044_01265, partial [Candidatus Hodarchaeales archaeon]|nr:hypothetical protein [Candidatus Hodarchaeales archaeon]
MKLGFTLMFVLAISAVLLTSLNYASVTISNSNAVQSLDVSSAKSSPEFSPDRQGVRFGMTDYNSSTVNLGQNYQGPLIINRNQTYSNLVIANTSYPNSYAVFNTSFAAGDVFDVTGYFFVNNFQASL